MKKLLYRGVNVDLHRKNKGELRPKGKKPFTRGVNWDEFQWDNFYWDNNDKNAVIEHQLQQAGCPTSGISTTPFIDRARFYATHGDEYCSGVLYVIDPDICKLFEVKLYVVSEIVPNPSIPEDDEVILVAKHHGAIPDEVVVDIQHFKNT